MCGFAASRCRNASKHITKEYKGLGSIPGMQLRAANGVMVAQY